MGEGLGMWGGAAMDRGVQSSPLKSCLVGLTGAGAVRQQRDQHGLPVRAPPTRPPALGVGPQQTAGPLAEPLRHQGTLVTRGPRMGGGEGGEGSGGSKGLSVRLGCSSRWLEEPRFALFYNNSWLGC